MAPALASANINIVFDYTYDTVGFFGSTQQSLLESAANVFESHISDSLDAIVSSGINHYNTSFYNPGKNDGSIVSLSNQSITADELRIYVGGASLGGSTLGQGGPGSYSVSGTSTFVASIDRGQSGVATDTDFAPWGGTLSFNSSYANWYFDTDPSTLESFSGKADFYSVAVHELGHLLGIGTADSWFAQVNTTSHIFNGTTTGSQPLSADNAHWQSGLSSTIDGTGSFEAAMDPTLTLGSRKEFTDLDWNALQDIGWQVAAVPEPETWAMMMAGLALVMAAAQRKRT